MSVVTLHKNKNQRAQEDKTTTDNNILRVLIEEHVEMKYLGKNSQKQKCFLLTLSNC